MNLKNEVAGMFQPAMEIEAFEYSSEQTVRDVLYSFFEHQLPKIENASTKGLHKQ